MRRYHAPFPLCVADHTHNTAVPRTLQFDIPATYPDVAPEIEIPELEVRHGTAERGWGELPAVQQACIEAQLWKLTTPPPLPYHCCRARRQKCTVAARFA